MNIIMNITKDVKALFEEVKAEKSNKFYESLTDCHTCQREFSKARKIGDFTFTCTECKSTIHSSTEEPKKNGSWIEVIDTALPQSDSWVIEMQKAARKKDLEKELLNLQIKFSNLSNELNELTLKMKENE